MKEVMLHSMKAMMIGSRRKRQLENQNKGNHASFNENHVKGITRLNYKNTGGASTFKENSTDAC